jgi:hypothetical protein
MSSWQLSGKATPVAVGVEGGGASGAALRERRFAGGRASRTAPIVAGRLW